MRASRLSAIVRHLGYSASPLTPAEYSALLATIQSTAPDAISQRLNLPPVTFCCAQCKTLVTRTAADFRKLQTRSRSGALYCGKKCMGIAKQTTSMNCPRCGQRRRYHGAKHCAVCAKTVREAKTAACAARRETICLYCGKKFTSHWKAGAARFCGMSCKNAAHSDRMQRTNNPNFKGSAAKTIARQHSYNRAMFRYAKIATLDRDKHQCALCACTKKLHVHHIDENPTNNSCFNLLTLCASCHRLAHSSLMTVSMKAIMCEKLKSLTGPYASLTYKSKRMRVFLQTEYLRTTAE